MARSGAVWLDVLPSMRNFASELRRQAARDAQAVGRAAGADMGAAMSAGASASFASNFASQITRQVGQQAGLLARIFRRAGDDAGRAGADAGRAYAEGFFRDAQGRLRDARGRFAAAGRAAGDGLGEGVDGGSSRRLAGLPEKLSGAMAKAGPWAAAGAAIGATVMSAMSGAMEKEQALTRFRAQIGEFGPEGQRLGKIAGELYADAYGEGLGDVTEALRGVRTNIADMATASDAELKRITAGAIRLGEVFGQDVGEVSRAVGKMIKTGLARDAQEALDILTRGFQTGANEADDLLDTFTEYSTQFRNMGLTGQQAMGLLSQGLRAGARDADVVADAIKEFSIEAVAGSDRIRDAYEELGLNADQMFKMLGRGGPDAAKALDITLDRLRAVKDPVERNALAVELFGTKAEDLGQALYALDPSEAVKSLGQVTGAAEQMDRALSETASSRLTAFGRTIKDTFINLVGGTILGNLEKLADRLGWIPDRLNKIKARASGLFSGLKTGPATSEINKISGSFGKVLDRLTDLGGKVRDLVGSIFESFRKNDNARRAIGDVSGTIQQFGDTLSSVADGVGTAMDRILQVIGWAVDLFRVLWDSAFGQAVATLVSNVFGGIVNTIEGALQTIQGVFQIFAGIFTGDWDKVWTGVKNVFGGIWETISSIPKAVLQSLRDALGGLLGGIADLFKKIFGGVKDWVVNTFTSLKNGAVSRLQSLRDGALSRIQSLRDGVASRLQALRDRAVSTMTGLRDQIVSRVTGLRDRVVGAVASLRDRVVDAFSRAASGVRSAWSRIEGYAKAPIRFVIDVVYNKGIRGVWNLIADKVPAIPSLGKMPLPEGFARGGVVDMRRGGVQPGYSAKDNRLALFRDGEGVLVPEAVQSLGKDFVLTANRLGRRANELLLSGLPGFQLGGIIGDFTKKAKKFFVGGFVRALESALGGLVDTVTARFGAGDDFAGIPGKMLRASFDGVVGWMKQFAGLLEGGDGRKVVEVARKYIGLSGNPNKFTRRMGMDGLPWCGMFVDGVFEEAGASKALAKVANPASVASYRVLPTVPRDAIRPGDLALYRGDAGHINIVVGKGTQTIGGNESNSVRLQSGYLPSASSIRRPAFARGGIVRGGLDLLAAIVHQDKAETSALRTPLRTLGLRQVLPVRTYDTGGYLAPGWTLAYNGTGRDELVVALGGTGPAPLAPRAGRPQLLGPTPAPVDKARKALEDLIKQLSKGLPQSIEQLEEFSKSLQQAVRDAFTGRLETRMLDTSVKLIGAMRSAAERAQQIADRIAAASEYAAQVTDQARQYVSLQSIGSTTVAGVLWGLERRGADLADFADAVEQLSRRGLRGSLLEQVIAMGPVQGLALARSLLKTDAQTLARLNAAQAAVEQAADRLGRNAADALFDSGKQASKGFLTGLQAQKAELDKLFRSLGDQLADQLASGLRKRAAQQTPQAPRPKVVLTSQQWQQVSASTRGGDGAAVVTYNVYPRQTTLDAAQLRAITHQEEIRARAGRGV